MTFILKIILAIVVFLLFWSQYVKTSSCGYKKFHSFYILYSLGFIAYIFSMNRLAIVFYVFAFYSNLKTFSDDDFYMDFKEWKKGKKISFKNQILILLSLKIDSDFECYRFNKKNKIKY